MYPHSFLSRIQVCWNSAVMRLAAILFKSFYIQNCIGGMFFYRHIIKQTSKAEHA